MMKILEVARGRVKHRPTKTVIHRIGCTQGHLSCVSHLMLPSPTHRRWQRTDQPLVRQRDGHPLPPQRRRWNGSQREHGSELTWGPDVSST